MLFIVCVSATSKDVQRKPVDVQTEIPNTENKEQRPAEPPIELDPIGGTTGAWI
jgi:hypothetical protein